MSMNLENRSREGDGGVRIRVGPPPARSVHVKQMWF